MHEGWAKQGKRGGKGKEKESSHVFEHPGVIFSNVLRGNYSLDGRAEFEFLFFFFFPVRIENFRLVVGWLYTGKGDWKEMEQASNGVVLVISWRAKGANIEVYISVQHGKETRPSLIGWIFSDAHGKTACACHLRNKNLSVLVYKSVCGRAWWPTMRSPATRHTQKLVARARCH
ncbi:hypothetical protein BDY21DRAFT_32823 [Lineolata rhizophorae]|uniref:Uncharacterized protein n=1 Tax=Lineolata rhizophorae TaxID=578093 RepID=A0A6A6NZT1_9PEZI|nr:hypothetical protein BDY21DRAFT_32823 [Lineolata rhizophorae]